MRPHAFPKSRHLLKRADFLRVYDHGTRYSSRLLNAFLLRNQQDGRQPGARIGFTVPRAIGKSVIRNKVRRRTREAVRLDYDVLGPLWDIVIHPRRAAADVPFAELRREVRKLFTKCENQDKKDAVPGDGSAGGL